MKQVSTGWGVAAALLAAVLCVQPAAAAQVKTTPDDQKSVAVTIYNDNLGLVKDVRTIRLPEGQSQLWFEGVAAKVDPTSVHIRSLTAPDALSILEQNFEYDLITPKRLMEKSVGKTVELVRTLEDGHQERVKARLIGVTDGAVYDIDGKIAINPEGRVVLPSLPEGLVSEPSLVWLLESRRRDHTIEASYLTGGISWKANYVVVLSADDKKADLSGWVTIDNQSGATYRNATLKLVAGNVNRVREEQPVPMAAMEKVRLGAAAPQFQQEAFFEYHLYTLERPSTVKDNQTKQIALLSAEDVGTKKTYVYAPGGNFFISRMGGPDTRTKVGVYVSFDNTKANHLGMPLPKGVVRVYKKDKDGALQFTGEDRIDHTPEDETIRIKLGDAFDVVAERVQTDFQSLGERAWQSSFKTTLRNHKDEDITVSVVEQMMGDWRIVRSSHDYVKESAYRVRFDVPVKHKSSAELTYTVTVHY